MMDPPTISTTSSSPAGDEPPVPVQHVAMKLLDVKLRPSTAIRTSLMGSFTASNTHEILLVKPPSTMEIYKIDTSHEKMKLLTRIETRSILRSVVKTRYPGETRDCVVVASDSGAISVLDFEHGKTHIYHCETYGKTGCRRSTPGAYVAADPAGRAVLVSSIEKRQLVFVLNRDSNGKPIIASPLEAHRNHTIFYDVFAIDNGHANPIFATIERQYPDTQELETSTNTNDAKETITSLHKKQLAYYELDLGLNHVTRRFAMDVADTACCGVGLPGGADGPGGALIGAENAIYYIHDTSQQSILSCPIPQRELHGSGGVLVTRIVVHKQKKSKFFALAQTELGDVFKISIAVENKTKVTQLTVALLDTLPVANALNISDLGLLFVAAEFGDHGLYQFLQIDLPDAPNTHSTPMIKKEKDEDASATNEGTTMSSIIPKFHPTILKNLRRIYSLDNPSPTTGVLVGELAGNEVSPQIYALTGRGPVSALRILRHGAAVTELANSELPGVPGGIFTVAGNDEHKFDKYIVVSFADATLVLSVGDTVEEVGKESGFLTNAPTLACSALGSDGAMCQVHPSGVRHIQNGQALQWHCPGLKRIECASANESQVIIALAGGEVIYFELDPMSGNLKESATRDMGADVCCLDVGTIPKGRSRSLLAAVGFRDQTVRIVSLEPGSFLVQRSSTALKARPHSVVLQTSTTSMPAEKSTSTAASSTDELTLVIGLDDGSSLRATVDPVTGSIGTSPTRRFLGARPVALSKITLESQSATLLLSSRPWISRRDHASGKHIMAPLSFAPLDHGCSFRSEAVNEGIIATAGKTLRILSVDAAGMGGTDDEAFNTNKVDLRYTPRQMTLINATAGEVVDQRRVLLVVVESDCNEYGLEEKKAMGFDPLGEGAISKAGPGNTEDDAMDMDEGSDDEGAKEEKKAEGEDDDDLEEKLAKRTPIRGPVPREPGHWASCVRLLDPTKNCETLDCIELGRNEAALCCASVRFHSKGGEPLLAVGTVTGMTFNPVKQTSSHIVLYRIIHGDRFQLLHRTPVDDGPVLAMAHFQGRLLVGIGKSLRLYEMGKRQLLRKCELRGLPTFVKTIQTVSNRAFVGDMIQSIQIIRYDSAANCLVMIANDPCPRPIVSQELLDWNTVAVGDKFGNIAVLRLPRGADASTIDLTGQRALWDSSRENATPKLELLCQYYVGEVVTSMTRSSLVAGGPESLIYVTVSGRIGALVPFTSRADVDFYTQLEAALRREAPRPTGRDPQSYRSYYAPVMHVIDGDLCDAFNSLSHEQQSSIAEKLDLSIGDIMKKLEDTRSSLL
jgi:splicing factor 3B subunit 3